MTRRRRFRLLSPLPVLRGRVRVEAGSRSGRSKQELYSRRRHHPCPPRSTGKGSRREKTSTRNPDRTYCFIATSNRYRPCRTTTDAGLICSIVNPSTCWPWLVELVVDQARLVLLAVHDRLELEVLDRARVRRCAPRSGGAARRPRSRSRAWPRRTGGTGWSAAPSAAPASRPGGPGTAAPPCPCSAASASSASRARRRCSGTSTTVSAGCRPPRRPPTAGPCGST